MSSQYDILVEYRKLVDLGTQLNVDVDIVSRICNIKGINKLKSKIRQEVAFLEKTKESNKLKKEHLTCSNLHHYEAFVKCLLNDSKCVAVLEVFCLKDETGGKKKIYVDFVSEEKRKWKKVIARNPKALSQISKGEGEYQQKSVVDHAIEFLECAKQNIVLFKPPVIEFYFASGIEKDLAEELQELGIHVTGKIVYCESDEASFELPPPDIQRLQSDVTKLNLDVTAMIAYVSAVTNGHADRKLRGQVLSQQAEWERLRPVKPILDEIFSDKELYACETAMTNFKSILEILGGEGEKKRSEEFIPRIRVVEDVPCERLKPGGQLRERARYVFGTGQAIQAITVTANSAFVRAALTQGIHLDVFLHEPRALTELKEIL